MFDLIRGGISFDWGVVHGPTMNNISTQLRQTVANMKTDEWTTTWAAQKGPTDAAVEAYIEKILALEN